MKPMKKIENIKQLEAEKKRLRQREVELEALINYHWCELKNSLKPKGIVGLVFSKVFGRNGKLNGSILIVNGITQIATKFAKKIVENAEEKISNWFKK